MTTEVEREIEEALKKRRFRPPMNEASDPSHDAHVRELRRRKEE